MAKTLIMAVMCQSCEGTLTENGKLKGPIHGRDLKELSKKGICHFCGRTLTQDENAALVTMTA